MHCLLNWAIAFSKMDSLNKSEVFNDRKIIKNFVNYPTVHKPANWRHWPFFKLPIVWMTKLLQQQMHSSTHTVLKQSQLFSQTQLLKHGSSEKCMAISRNKDKIIMESCNEAESRHMWTMENFNPSRLSPELIAD